MSNSTNTELVDAFASSFLSWFQNDILPVVVVTFDLVAIITGVILNVLLIVTFRKRGLFAEPSTHFVFALVIVDFVAYPFVLLPTIVAALAKQWLMTIGVCYIHGSLGHALMLISFSVLVTLAFERMLKLRYPDVYDKCFTSRKFLTILIVATCLTCTVIAFIPAMGWSAVRYDFYHQGCVVDYLDNYALLNIHFVLTIGLSSLVVLVTYSLIFDTRRRALIASRAPCFTHTKLPEEQDAKPGMDRSIEDTHTDNKASDSQEKPQNKRSPVETGILRKRPRLSARRKSSLFEVFSDDEENPAFHLAITYLLLWGTLMCCYLPYFIIVYYDAYNEDPVWGGWFTLAMIPIHSSFVLKPVIYLGHNRHYRKVTKATVPARVRNRANAVRASISSAVDAIDDFVFKPVTANEKFATALTTQRAVLVWKRKLRIRQQKKASLKASTSESSPVTAVSLNPKPLAEAGQPQGSDNTLTPGSRAPVTTVATASPDPRSPVTPSALAIQVSPSPSSYIEKERQKLLSTTVTMHPISEEGAGDGQTPLAPGVVSSPGLHDNRPVSRPEHVQQDTSVTEMANI